MLVCSLVWAVVRVGSCVVLVALRGPARSYVALRVRAVPCFALLRYARCLLSLLRYTRRLAIDFLRLLQKMQIEKSEREDKRLKAIFGTRVIHFGSPSPSRAYVDHGDAEKRRAYLARHKPRENWDNPFSAGALARWVLWGNSTDINKNIGAYRKRFSM